MKGITIRSRCQSPLCLSCAAPLSPSSLRPARTREHAMNTIKPNDSRTTSNSRIWGVAKGPERWESAQVSHKRVFALLTTEKAPLDMAKMLQKPVFALLGCQRMSVNTLLCDTLTLAEKGPPVHGSRSSREIDTRNASCRMGGGEVTGR